MKFYVSGKLGDSSITKSVIAVIREAGHEITLDWTTLGSLKPYDLNVEAASSAAIDEVNAVWDADALIMIPHSKGVGMFVELGVALGCGIPVYIITGTEEGRSRSIFLYHPLVKEIGSVEELLENLHQ